MCVCVTPIYPGDLNITVIFSSVSFHFLKQHQAGIEPLIQQGKE